MKKNALAVFRQPPDKLNCAQSIVHAHGKVFGDTSISDAEMKSFGGGRAPGGLCGALYAACTLLPEKAEQLQSEFAVRLGSALCKDLRSAKQYPCEACVSHAADLVESYKRDQTT